MVKTKIDKTKEKVALISLLCQVFGQTAAVKVAGSKAYVFEDGALPKKNSRGGGGELESLSTFSLFAFGNLRRRR